MAARAGHEFRDLGGKLSRSLTGRLAWWAEWQFRLLQPQPGGGSLADHFRVFERATGKKHPEDRQPTRPPQSLLYLWQWFHEIAQGRPVTGMGGYLPIPSAEMQAWCRLNDRRLDVWEIEAIRLLDMTFIRVMSEKLD